MKRSPLRTRRKPWAPNLRRDEFKLVLWRRCAVCGTEGYCRRHHVTRQRDVAAKGGDEWALDNALWLGVESTCSCHSNHHSRSHPIPLPLVPDAAVSFAVDLFGSDEKAAAYLVRVYAPEVN